LVSNFAVAQEKIDSLNLLKPNERILFIPNDFDPHLHYKTEEATVIPEYEKQMEEYIFQGKGWKQFKLTDNINYFPDGKIYQLYSSANNALHYFSASDPIYFGVDFHLRPITKWEKIDIYFYSNGLLFNRYTDINPQPASPSTRNFLLEVGGGFEYEYREENFLFYERSGVFINQTFTGWRNKAGFRFRF
jgi:hypothetical protein